MREEAWKSFEKGTDIIRFVFFQKDTYDWLLYGEKTMKNQEWSKESS